MPNDGLAPYSDQSTVIIQYCRHVEFNKHYAHGTIRRRVDLPPRELWLMKYLRELIAVNEITFVRCQLKR